MQPEGFILFFRCKTSMMGAPFGADPRFPSLFRDLSVRGKEAGTKRRGKWWATAMSGVLLGLLLTTVDPALQLRRDIQADRYLQAEKGIREQDFEGAKEAINRIPAFQAQHGLEIPEQFFSGTRRYWIGLSSTKQRPRI